MAGVPIARLTTEQLTVGERADLEAALKDPGRFHSDGKEVTIAAVVLPLLLIPLEAVLVNEVRGSFHVYADSEVPLDYFRNLLYPHISMLWNPEFLQFAGVVLIPVAIAAIAAYGVRTHGRHGHAITSFGVVRIRGNTLRLLRYADIAQTKIGERRLPQHQVITDELEIVAKDGASLSLYGFGLEQRKALIDAHLPVWDPRATSPRIS
jgi:hypothetical protein